MSNQLKENLNTILEEKNTKLLPENLKAGVTCLGVTGELEGGVDTSDATATVLDIVSGKTAYVNGEKIEGMIPDYRNIEVMTSFGEANLVGEDILEMKSASMPLGTEAYYGEGTVISMQTSAKSLGLIPESIVKGTTILGMEGTAEIEAPTVPEGTVCLMHLENDISNAITGEVISTPTSSNFYDGKFNKCYGEPSTRNYINLSSVTSKLPTISDLANGATMTIECWYRTTSQIPSSTNRNYKSIICFDTRGYGCLMWHYDRFSLYFNVSGAVDMGDADSPYNNWVHLALVAKDGRMNLYVNGKNIGSTAIDTTIGSTIANLQVGTTTGQFDEILVSTEALYTEDFTPPTKPYKLPPLDTSDATATENDIVVGKTAYVNGEKITGTVYEVNKDSNMTLDFESMDDFVAQETVCVYSVIPDDYLFRETSRISTPIGYHSVAEAINLQSNQIAKGNTILGIEGTAETGVGKADLKFISFYGSNLSGTSVIEELNKVNTEAFTHINGMFYNCQNIISLDLTPITFGNLTSMANTFNMCINMTTLNLSHLSTENVTNMNFLFYRCSNLQELDISSFDFSNVKYYQDAFVSIPDDCLIYVKDQTAKDWLLSAKTTFTNIQIKS